MLSNEEEISREDLEKVQDSIEKEKIGHGDDEGKLYLGTKDHDINCRLMAEEKKNDAKNFANPECELYFMFPILNEKDEDVGDMIMEIKDHHSHESTIYLRFNAPP